MGLQMHSDWRVLVTTVLVWNHECELRNYIDYRSWFKTWPSGPAQRTLLNFLCSCLKAISHWSRFARAGGATNFNHVKNQSPGHAKKVECSSTFMACPLAFRRTKNAQDRQLQRKLSNVRSTRAGKATAMENGLNLCIICPPDCSRTGHESRITLKFLGVPTRLIFHVIKRPRGESDCNGKWPLEKFRCDFHYRYGFPDSY